MQLLKDKNILLGVTGSIAIYKALELVRLFVKSGANVKVLMSEDAKKFVTPLSFEALSSHAVISSETENWSNENNHIKINKWADLFVIVPATANTINKLSCGIADNLLLSTALGFTKQILLAPATNSAMFLHQTTQNSLKNLENFGYKIINPVEKLLACGDVGKGALANPELIFFECVKALHASSFWKDKNVIVTGGGTIEKIDDVRFISNFSSGKMADSLSLALYLKGANVTFIKTYKDDEILPLNYIHVTSAKEMSEAVNLLTKQNDYLFMVAAVGDFRAKEQQNGKIKKENLDESFSLEFTKNVDILSLVDKKNLKTVGFKAELDKKSALSNAENMLKNKNLDAVCLNVIDSENPFGSDENEVTFITKTSQKHLSKKSKQEIAFEILENLEEL